MMGSGGWEGGRREEKGVGLTAWVLVAWTLPGVGSVRSRGQRRHREVSDTKRCRLTARALKEGRVERGVAKGADRLEGGPPHFGVRRGGAGHHDVSGARKWDGGGGR